jgi:hypothetical protein
MATRQLVQRRDALGHLQRVVDGEQEDVRADPDALGAGCDRAEEQQRVARPTGREVVVAQRQRVVATALGQARERERGGVRVARAGSWKTGRLRENFIGLLVGPSWRGVRAAGEVAVFLHEPSA